MDSKSLWKLSGMFLVRVENHVLWGNCSHAKKPRHTKTLEDARSAKRIQTYTKTPQAEVEEPVEQLSLKNG